MRSAHSQGADLDSDGRNDALIVGSSTGQNGVPGFDGRQYDFAALFNRNGAGTDLPLRRLLLLVNFTPTQDD